MKLHQKTPPSRTLPQNAAMHLWFKQIADACKDAGIDGKMMMSKTISVEMNEHIIKGMWKALQQALYGKKSTTELSKTGEIDHLQDHFIRFFAEELELEIPSFPARDKKSDLLEGMKIDIRNSDDYPDE